MSLVIPRFGHLGLLEEQRAMENLAERPEVYGLQQSPVVSFDIIDWTDVALQRFGSNDNPKGKARRLWDDVKKLSGKHLPNTAQLLGDCVGAGMEMALEFLQAGDIVTKGEFERYRPIHRPYLYGIGRVFIGRNRMGCNQDGSLGSWQVAAIKKYGVLAEDEPGVPRYSTAVGREFGCKERTLNEWVPIAQKNLVEFILPIKNFEEAAKAVIIGGWPLTIASSQGMKMDLRKDTRANKSWFVPSGTWAHQMHIPAVDYGQYPSVFINNQWGYSAHRGQLDGPDGGGWIDAEFFDRWCRKAEVFAVGNFNGWKPKKPIFDMI